MESVMNIRLLMITILLTSLSHVLPGNSSAHASPVAVGEITMRLGQVRLVDKEGIEREALIKNPIFSGDRINTQTGGHLHIRFVDGGMVSVRPGSLLQIEDYSPHQESTGKSGAIRFKLERGVMRSITGQWGQTARERFRLNTPFAAIGVKGTDFLVQSTENNLQVLVHSGAIILTPFSETCRAEALGPCHGESARELSADMGSLMLELQRNQRIPQLLPKKIPTTESSDAAPNETGTKRKTAPAQEQEFDAAPKEVETKHKTVPMNESNDILNLATADSALQKAADSALQKVADSAPRPASLIWGRWANIAQRPGDVLTVSRHDIPNEYERIAENDYYALYRLPETAGIPVNTKATVSFGIQSAQAHLVSLSEIQAATVNGGQLTLDFAARQFNTNLNLSSLPTGTVSLQANGPIRPDGSFNSFNIYTRVKGGVTSDQRNAAYLFEQSTPKGMLTGIVNWQ